ncbi:MAG: hypothetical protein GY786_20555, partial [Proteobacteria bacterium]|nr:hypothetical protein [Pseudomonadota bacterium]
MKYITSSPWCDTNYKPEETKKLIDEIEDEVLESLHKDIEDRESLITLVQEFNLCQTKEAKIVKFADILDAFAHARVRLGRTFDKYLEKS